MFGRLFITLHDISYCTPLSDMFLALSQHIGLIP